MAPAPSNPIAANPTKGLTPTTTDAEPPVEVMSAKAWPAKDWPLITVNTPTGAQTQATTNPTTAAVCTAEFPKNPGWNIACQTLIGAGTERWR
jgi:hypothetical protein